jgi:hypothetical protein
MISRAVEAEVLRLHHAEHWPIGTIARQLLLHHSTVRRVLAQAGVPAAQKTTRPSLADPFVPFIIETLKQYPALCASRLYVMVRERGYRGGADHFRSIVARTGLAAKLPFSVHPHMLRHACGFKLANEGHDTRSLQQHLGHKNIAHTVRYTDMAPERFKGFWKD